MRHLIVSRVTVLLASFFLVAALLFVRLVTPELERNSAPGMEAAIDGSALFDTHCSSCHASDAFQTEFRELSDVRRRQLEQFLADHGDAAPEEDRAILAYLSRKFPRPRD